MAEDTKSDEVLFLDDFDCCSANSSFTFLSDPEDVVNNDFKTATIPLLAGERTLLEGPSADGRAVLTNYRLYHKGYEGDGLLNVPLGLVSHVRVKGGVMFVFCKNGRSYSLAFHLEDIGSWVKEIQSKLNHLEIEACFAFSHFLDSTQAKPPSDNPQPSNAPNRNGCSKYNGNNEKSKRVSNGTNGCLEKAENGVEFIPQETLSPSEEVIIMMDDNVDFKNKTLILKKLGNLEIYDTQVLTANDAFTEYKDSLFQAENKRMEFNFKDVWRISLVNKYYELCSSYPQYIITPATVSDSDLLEVSKYRRAGRLPAVVWRHQRNGCVIARCSQPSRGILGYNSLEDQKLVAAISEACLKDAGKGSPSLLIVDARSNTAAIANRALKGGYEDVSYYPNCEIAFMDIENIHKVSKSLDLISILCATPDQVYWLTELGHTHWMSYISSIIQGALVIVNAVNDDARPVLVHCSDGWDRTSQLTSLSQLLMDPYYRTIKGFSVLVEREWLSFGHKFADRCGHWNGTDRDEEHSPVFLQWLDCVFQLTQQFPCHFEFNEHYLIRLVIHTYSGLFGTFFCNTEKERYCYRLWDQTFSIWTALKNVKEFYNEFYCENAEVLRPSCQIRNLKFWSNMYLPNNFVSKNIFKLLPVREENDFTSNEIPPRKTSSPRDNIDTRDAENPLETSDIPEIIVVGPNLLEQGKETCSNLVEMQHSPTLHFIPPTESGSFNQDLEEQPSSFLGSLDMLSSILPNLYSMYEGSWSSFVPSFNFYGDNSAEEYKPGSKHKPSKRSGTKQGNDYQQSSSSKWVFEAKKHAQKRPLRVLEFDGLFIQEDFVSGMARMFRSKIKECSCKQPSKPMDPELISLTNS